MSAGFWDLTTARRVAEIAGLDLNVAEAEWLRRAYKECPDTPLVNGAHCRRFEFHGRVHDQDYVRQRVESRGGPQGLHRVIREMYDRQRVPPGMEVHHECGNAWCGEPAHLRVLPAAEHRQLEARRHSGEHNPRARHTDAQVGESVALYEQGCSAAEVGRQMNVPKATVQNWVAGRTRRSPN